MSLKSPDQIMLHWGQIIEAGRQNFAEFSERYLFTIPGENGGSWVLCAAATPPVRRLDSSSGGPPATCRITLESDVLEAIAAGKLNPQTAHLNGKMRLSGPLPQLLELNFILDRLLPEPADSTSPARPPSMAR